MRNSLPLVLLALLFLYGCAKEEIRPDSSAEKGDPLTAAEMNEHIKTSIEQNGVFNWSTVSDHFLWSAGMRSDSVFALGYQAPGTTNLNDKIHEIDIKSEAWKNIKEKILELILEGERELELDYETEDLLPYGMPEALPTMAVRITNPATISRLRGMSEVRYLECMSYSIPSMTTAAAADRSSSGCDSAPNYNINSNDYTTITPGVKQSWHHATSNISGAWSETTGDGVTVCVIDTGADYDQENLGLQFNSGYSSGRFVHKYSTKYSGSWWWRRLDSPDDQCGHGTSMCGLAAAPRGTDGNAVGVAYNADLISIRAVEDVVINTGNEKNGVKDALVLAGNRSDVRVISMSIGTPFYSGTVADGIYYAYNKGKMIIAAAGTSFSWTSWWGVIFPATMSQTVAVTGVKDGSGPMQKCASCHDGSAVDFVMVMERSSNTDRHAITLANYSNTPKYIGGSSAATASVAGIATLIYAKHDGISRSAVFNRMKTNASFYPYESNNFGWGIIDASAAVD